jgi:hypothetical protein
VEIRSMGYRTAQSGLGSMPLVDAGRIVHPKELGIPRSRVSRVLAVRKLDCCPPHVAAMKLLSY